MKSYSHNNQNLTRRAEIYYSWWLKYIKKCINHWFVFFEYSLTIINNISTDIGWSWNFKSLIDKEKWLNSMITLIICDYMKTRTIYIYCGAQSEENVEFNASIPKHLDVELKYLPTASSITNLEYPRSSNRAQMLIPLDVSFLAWSIQR